MATLQQAVDAGWDDFAHMQKDSDLAILRDREEFKALLLLRRDPAESSKAADEETEGPAKQPAKADRSDS